MSTRQAALSSTSPAAIALASAHADKTAREAAAAAPAAAAAAAEVPAAVAAAAAPAIAAAAAMTAPKAGEKCELCGAVKPKDPEDTADDGEENVKKSARILELCTIAGAPAKTAQEFTSKGMSVKQVRAELLRRAADAGNAAEVDATAAPAGDKEAAVAALWDDIVTKQNAKLGFKPR